MAKNNIVTRLTPAVGKKIQAEMLVACRKIADSYGLVVEDAGGTSRSRDPGFSFEAAFRIVGIETRRPRYPVSVERIPDRQGYKFAAENVAMLLKAQKNS